MKKRIRRIKRAQRKTYTKCPKCGAGLQATVPFYLSEVRVDKDGFIDKYRPAFDSTSECINLDEPELVQIYCENDHPFDLSKAVRAKTNV